VAIERFEDIAAWQGARVLVKAVHRTVDQGPFARNYSLCDQICRASVSIMSNIAEGFERGSDNDFRRFLFMAKGSAGEVRSLLYVALDLEYIDHATYQDLMNQSAKISRQIGGFIKYLDSNAILTNGRAKQA
jgi:four helix bundle protein